MNAQIQTDDMKRQMEESQYRSGRQQVDDPWTSLQAIFVDDPKRAVDEANKLVRGRLQQFIEQLDAVRQRVSSQTPSAASTEELRLAFQRLRNIALNMDRARM